MSGPAQDQRTAAKKLDDRIDAVRSAWAGATYTRSYVVDTLNWASEVIDDKAGEIERLRAEVEHLRAEVARITAKGSDP